MCVPAAVSAGMANLILQEFDNSFSFRPGADAPNSQAGALIPRPNSSSSLPTRTPGSILPIPRGGINSPKPTFGSPIPKSWGPGINLAHDTATNQEVTSVLVDTHGNRELTSVPHNGIGVGGKARSLNGGRTLRSVYLTLDGHIRLKDILAVSNVSRGAEILIAENPNWGPHNQGVVKYPNHLEVYDPHNQRIGATGGSLQPLARNIATGLSYQCLEKNNDKLGVGILTSDIQVFVASVLLK